MVKKLRKSELELMVAYCWAVWYSRNKFIFEGQKLEPNLAATKAESIMAAYQRVRKPVPAPPDTSRTGKKQKWTPPPENLFKVNVDAAISSKNQMAAYGAVIRNARGNIVAAGIN